MGEEDVELIKKCLLIRCYPTKLVPSANGRDIFNWLSVPDILPHNFQLPLSS